MSSRLFPRVLQKVKDNHGIALFLSIFFFKKENFVYIAILYIALCILVYGHLLLLQLSNLENSAQDFGNRNV